MLKDPATKIAVTATLHCLTGCAIGEVSGMVIGTALGITNLPMLALSIGLAFLFGYAFTAWPLLKSGMSLRQAASIALAADTLSIATMELTDNATLVIIPGALNANISNPFFWISLLASLLIAFLAAVPVNKYLISRGRGHALVHHHHHHHK